MSTFQRNSFDIISGLRVLFDSPHYETSELYRSGYMLLSNGHRHHFTLINNLCKTEEMGLFNHYGLAKAVEAGYKQLGLNGGLTGSVVFDTERTGITNI